MTAKKPAKAKPVKKRSAVKKPTSVNAPTVWRRIAGHAVLVKKMTILLAILSSPWFYKHYVLDNPAKQVQSAPLVASEGNWTSLAEWVRLGSVETTDELCQIATAMKDRGLFADTKRLDSLVGHNKAITPANRDEIAAQCEGGK